MRSAGKRLLILVSRLGRLRNSQGQDLVEYAMLAGFVAVAGGALIPWGTTGPISSIFSKLNVYLVQLGGA
ncbi:MAG: Flp family type IVb pilin [Bryobacteraceae bacterium]|nr:Flp family type IVb pilin [Bryobacteraceae bacterium]